ncbi:putative glucan endo-1,3-beta-glucosidase precursor [Talaromyces proteolyticus]|uniref:Glucan endo-1,3-beta-glucosidase n=1 Tax=Talaromyces proteolyticus TaxID=1131652 RepID=A0AAD4KM92_9EURO|nr:putative glucan endo-1,3-beta-glucosidase precursor [Talaromyces proteolyticus]KAH8696027.1 putative glucan endo-1,3-beta-glucosidase precursor [Talaromyces proteolyticus]
MAHQKDTVKAATTATTLDIVLQNQTTSGTVYAYITGLAIDNNNALFLLKSDGKTAYYPTSPSGTQAALGADCAIPLGAVGNSVTATIPRLAGARLWFSRDATITFYLNPGPALVEPSPSNKSDPNYNTYWDFCEFTFNDSQLYANISYVDFVSLPISLTLTNTSGQTQHISGLPSNGLDTICSGLNSQQAKDNAGWNQLIVQKNGANLRAVSPNTGIVMNSSLFNGYYSSYVDQVWSKYSSGSLTVNTQMSAGNVGATVSNNVLNFGNGAATYSKPAATDIFSCSSGPFAVSGNQEKDAITARLAAAFNRSTLLVNNNTPANENPSNYYQNPITNHYARIVHAANLDKRGYSFPYDDVAPTNGADQSGSVFDGSPKSLTVVVGGGNATAGPSAPAKGAKDSKDANTPSTSQPGQGGQGGQGTKKGINWQSILDFLKGLPCFKA